jgi:hypothetical protein
MFFFKTKKTKNKMLPKHVCFFPNGNEKFENIIASKR